MNVNLLRSIGFGLLAAVSVYGSINHEVFSSSVMLDCLSLFFGIILIGTAWHLTLVTGNGRNILRQFFCVIFLLSLWLLLLDLVNIVFGTLDVIPRGIRLMVFRGGLSIGMIILAIQLRRSGCETRGESPT